MSRLSMPNQSIGRFLVTSTGVYGLLCSSVGPYHEGSFNALCEHKRLGECMRTALIENVNLMKYPKRKGALGNVSSELSYIGKVATLTVTRNIPLFFFLCFIYRLDLSPLSISSW